jgi:hypothetical protein
VSGRHRRLNYLIVAARTTRQHPSSLASNSPLTVANVAVIARVATLGPVRFSTGEARELATEQGETLRPWLRRAA